MNIQPGPEKQYSYIKKSVFCVLYIHLNTFLLHRLIRRKYVKGKVNTILVFQQNG